MPLLIPRPQCFLFPECNNFLFCEFVLFTLLSLSSRPFLWRMCSAAGVYRRGSPCVCCLREAERRSDREGFAAYFLFLICMTLAASAAAARGESRRHEIAMRLGAAAERAASRFSLLFNEQMSALSVGREELMCGVLRLSRVTAAVSAGAVN